MPNPSSGAPGWERVHSLAPDTYSSFWKTVVESPQWRDWETEVSKRFARVNEPEPWNGVFDVDECRECGWISQPHFQAFLEFVRDGWVAKTEETKW